MKKLLLLIFLLTFSLGYSQGVAQAFETDGISGAPFGNAGFLPTVTREAGPGTNTTQVIKFVGNTGSALWQGVDLSLTTNLNLTAATTRTMSIDVYASGPLFFLVKVNGGIAGAPEAAAVVEYTGTNTWQTCSFTFNSVRDGKAAEANGTYANFVLHAYWPSAVATTFPAGNATARTLYVDNITGPLALPSATVGTFTVPSKLVGDATFTITPPTSNNTSAFTYTSSNTAVGTIVNGNQIQVGSIGSSTITAAQVSDGTYAATSKTATFDVTPSAATTPPVRNAWDVVSLYSDSYTPTSGATWQAGADVLTAVGNNARFFNGFTLARLAFAARSVTGMTTLHIDVYTVNQNQLWLEINGNRKVQSSIALNNWVSFDIPLTDYVGLNLGNVSFFDLNNPTGAAAPVKQVYLDNIYFYRAATTQPPTLGALTVPSPKTVGDAPFTLTNPTSNSSGAWTYSSNPAGVVTFSGNTATIVGGGTTTITATQAADGSYGAGTATASLVVNYPAPGASPVPTVRDAGCVVSMYTGTPTTYANVVATSQANWSTGSTNSNFSFVNGTDTCIQVNNLGFFGLVTSDANFSVSTMSTLHVDIYVNTPMTTMILNLLAPSDRNYSVGPLVTGWNSFDIPLTAFGSDFTNINGIKFEQSGGTARQIYIDNVYFYSGGTPTLTNFNNIGKVTGDAAFSLTAPTSASVGAFTYTSSNIAVATISGSTVTLVGAGTSTITATQAANGCFASGTATATLTVGATVPVAAPTAPPARNAWDVKSIYSTAYTNEPGVSFSNFGSAAAITDQTLADASVVKKYATHTYSGIQVIAATGLDVKPATSGMTTLHMDVYSPNFTSFKIKLEAFNGSNLELSVPGGTSQYSWISYDIPLSTYSAVDLERLKFIVPVSSGNATLYVTNVYFYRAATVQPPTLGTFTVPAKVIGDAAFTLTPPTSNSAGAFTYTSSNTAVATISGDTVTIVGAGSSTITATQAADGSYGAGTKTAVLTVSFPLPTTGAPSQPARNAWDVVSLYSGDYTATAGAGWQNGADVSLSGNNARFFNGFTLARLAFTTVNLTTAGMAHLHLSVYTHNQNQLWFEIQGNRRVESSIALNGWVEFNIPLSEYTGLNLANINFFDLNNPTGAADPVKVVYMDDVYFYRPATAEPPTIGTFTVPAKVIGDAAFTLTAPTSNSAGAFTYTSSNTAVATISGNTVTIVGVGSSTITATQAANGVYGQGSKTATLSVTPPSAPTPPARNSSNVVSLYSDSYTPTSGATWQAGADVLTSVGNNARYFNDFTLARLAFAARSVTGMTTLHIDVYTLNQNQLWFEINGNRKVVSSIPLNGWASFDIPLTDYVGLNLGNVSFFDLNNPTGAAAPAKIVYLDNIYFYKQDTWLGTTSTNWATATNWGSGAAPTTTSDVVIASSANQPIIGSDVSINSLTINSGTTLTVNSGFNLTVANTVANSGTMTLQNNANLLQDTATTTNSNSGSIFVKRNSASLLRLDHTLWSSPVASQNLYTYSPLTLTNRFYTYNTVSNGYVTTGLDATTTFAAGKGYAVRAPNDHSAVTPTTWEGTFTGIPNNGTVPFTLDNTLGFNLVGNPYPSPISANSFLTANSTKVEGTLYFYAHSLPMNANGTFPTGTNYSTWNSSATTVATRAEVGSSHNITIPATPNGIIQVGQGFFVKATAPGTINFTNAMRVGNNDNQFFRTTEIERHRMWLNLTTENDTDINQIAVAYVEGATQNADSNFDGLSFGNNGSMLSSKINGADYVIQGRSLPFDSNDIVPLGFKATTTGNYKIKLTNKDGLFLGNQDVFVRDNLMGIEHNIKVSPYTFASEIGTFDARFQLVYTQRLATPSSVFTSNSVLVTNNPDGFHVTTNGIVMKDIHVYDISGRLIFKHANINGTSTVLKGLSQVKQVLLLKITSQENETVTVKAIN